MSRYPFHRIEWRRGISLPAPLCWAFSAFLAAGSASAASRPLLAPDFLEAAPQGFDDRHNSEAMSMLWWKNRLYVGTNRANACVQQAVLAFHRPDLGDYPPTEADLECTALPQDLPLQAEIWRWSPITNQWEMVYRSPQDVPIPGHPGKFVARDIAFRGLQAFKEADGTEALYVSGVSARGFNEPGLPPPRILRSTDGETFEPIPQDPGTFLGDIPYIGFRGTESYKGRFFILASVGDLGHGVILESTDPASGNDSFRLVTPPEMTFFELAVFNDFLYLGTGVQPVNNPTPFSLLKTDASGTPPYALTPIITDGAYRRNFPSYAVISMQEFRNRLYVGTERELLRVNADDSWELVVGTPRTTPDGRQLKPLSGFDYGFDYFFNIHMWRMAVHDGHLYVGTQDQSARWRNNPFLGPLLQAGMGFDLFATGDGRHFTEISRNGFTGYFDYHSKQVVIEPDNVLNRGARSLTSTPFGLFLGSANPYYGTKVWRARPSSAPELPVPANLEVEGRGASTLLSWEPSAGAAVYQIFRDRGFHPAELIGTTPNPFYVDSTAMSFPTYHYSVTAASAQGVLSGPSNLVRSPSLAPTETFLRLSRSASDLGLPRALRSQVFLALRQAMSGRLAGSLATLQDLRTKALLQGPILIGPRKTEDLVAQLDGLIRRVNLAILGLISPGKLIL